MRTLLMMAILAVPTLASSQTKPAITLDEFMNSTEITSAKLSPDGTAAVVGVESPDWKDSRYNEDLWLWTRDGHAARPLTHSGHDTGPQWSPDGQTIAFLSDLGLPSDGAKKDAAGRSGTKGADSKDDEPARIWLLPLQGGDAVPLFAEKLDVHAFAWSADGTKIIFAVSEVLSKDAEDAETAEWKDVVRWREQEHGDVLLEMPVAAVLQPSAVPPVPHPAQKTASGGSPTDRPEYPAGATVLTHSRFAIDEVAAAPSGNQIAFETGPVSRRLEDPADTELYVVEAKGGEARRLTNNQGLESHLCWTPDSKAIDLLVSAAGGSIEGPYQDVQGRLYSVEASKGAKTGAVTRLGGTFTGSWEDFTVAADGTLFATGLTGIDQQIYRVDGESFTKAVTLPGNYGELDASRNGKTLLFTHSTINTPTQVYVADVSAAMDDAKAVTAFNPLFAQRAQASWRPYRWTSTDGTPVEGVLIFPVGYKEKKGAKPLRMLTLIHGGPADADGDRFGANWYDWATLAAAQGWLVFRPNYRGSSGYGDAFMQGIRPHLVSVPGQDILSGVDALVKDGLADPDKLAIGGYSYGGYMTNWLITQTTRFKAAVTGAGAVEHAANWGNDDLTFDDAWYLSGTPWQKPELYQSEAALFRLDKVKTPTHIVGGDADDRVSFLEDVLLERCLQALNVPHALLVFPGENHPLNKDPWHGYIKVRDELKWLETYDPK